MYSTILNNYDWTKAASQVVDDQAVEKAFADQAYGFVANKVGVLMQDPYQLGFEIVSKNDANTRMVGIFAFRVNGSLLYVPAFFLNGEIKGTDLLYRVDVKKFVNNTEDWITFLREHGNRDIGQGIDRSISRKIPYRMHMERLVSPPHLKGASVHDKWIPLAEPICGMTWVKGAALEDSWEEVLRDMFRHKPAEKGVLRNFLEEFGTADHIDKLASMIESSPKFADALVRTLGTEDYMPPAMLDRIEKEAAAKQVTPTEPELVLYRGLHPEATKLARAGEIFENGYLVDDRRAEDTLSVVYADVQDCLTQVNNPGIYKVLLSDGTMEDALVATKGSTVPGEGADCCVKECCPGLSGCDGSLPKLVLLLNGDKSLHHVREYNKAPSIWGAQTDDEQKYDETEQLQREMSSGKGYIAFDTKTGEATPYFRVVRKTKRKNGLIEYSISPRWSNREYLVVVNPELEDSDVGRGFLGASYRFVEVADQKSDELCCNGEWEPKDPVRKLADDSVILRRNFKPQGTKRASIQINPTTAEYVISMDGKSTCRLNREEAAVKLATELLVKASDAEDLLNDVNKEGVVHFLLFPKTAAALTLTHDPVFKEDYDPVFGINVRQPERIPIPAQYIGERVPANRIGDGFNPPYQGKNADNDTVPIDILMNGTPDEIAQYAEQNATSSVFEHGVMGSLLQTYDASTAVDQYIPKMEDGLDHLGRTLFLFYWKPSDFEQNYGTDDMRNMEDKLLSTFKQFGDIVLELLRKTRRRRTSGPSF